jgi:proteasome accessory factor B
VSYWRVATGEVVERDVDVFGWARRRGEWIFVGHCHLREGVRIFYLSRVRGLKEIKLPKDEAVARARRGKKGDYDVPEEFDVRAWSRQQIWDYDVHPPAAAAVRFRGSLARLAKQLLPAADVTTDASGARVARLEVRNLRGLVRQALAWGPEAEVVEPPEARATAREILDGILAPRTWGTP